MKYQRRAARLLMHIRPAPLAVLLKRLLRIRRMELGTAEGKFWIDPASYLGLTLDRDGVYEPRTLAAIKSLLRPGDCFVDVGANEGYFSVAASRCVGAGGRVIAVEPQDRAIAALRRNLELNGCGNVRHEAVGISDAPGTALLNLTPDMNNSASGLSVPTRYRLPVQEIRLTTLADLFSGCAVAEGAVVKMDIEGWEYEAILGSPELFRAARIRALVLELHPHLIRPRGLEPEKILQFLDHCGYRTEDQLVWAKPAAG